MDGRFGSGPSKVRPEALQALVRAANTLLGTSHRRDPVRDVVGEIRSGLTELFALPDTYEVLLGNGGAAFFWDAACFGLIHEQSQHWVFGEFSSKFAAAVRECPHLKDPVLSQAQPGDCPSFEPSDCDAYALTHNETSTGVSMSWQRGGDGLFLVDATSAAGGVFVDPLQFDVYYFSPQKCFAAEAGLWVALCSPFALDRIASLRTRWTPPSLSLGIALDESRRNQTYNTPSVATLLLLRDSVRWLNSLGGLAAAASRSRESSDAIYAWASASSFARPFVTDPTNRSPVVATIDFDEPVDAARVCQILRQNGIVDLEPYRKLARNQLRIGVYPAVDRSDVDKLLRAIDFVVETLGS